MGDAKKSMKAAIFDPYLDTLGGGERYVMTVASVLVENGWDVDIEWNDKTILKKLEDRLGLDLKDMHVVPSINKGKGYDLVFWVSDGSVPNLAARHNILHFQVPFHDVGGKSIANRLKLRKIKTIICNSKFTKKFIEQEYGVNSVVIYPPIDVDEFKTLTKENIILSVGRFSQLLQAKGQEILIDAFKKLVNGELENWKLILAGGSDVGGRELVSRLTESAKGHPIEVIENPNFNELKILYGKAKIFWSASGYGIDEEKEPEKVEHFGITVVEAMATGCAPIITNKGGHREIVKELIDGVLWDSVNQLISVTKMLITNESKLKTIAKNAQTKAQNFSQKRFEDEFMKLVN